MFTIDAYVGKSFRIHRKYNININLTVSNLLNNKDLITGGFEQLRLGTSTEDGTTDITKFPNKLLLEQKLDPTKAFVPHSKLLKQVIGE